MQIMEIRSGCGLPLAMLQTWLIHNRGWGKALLDPLNS